MPFLPQILDPFVTILPFVLLVRFGPETSSETESDAFRDALPAAAHTFRLSDLGVGVGHGLVVVRHL